MPYQVLANRFICGYLGKSNLRFVFVLISCILVFGCIPTLTFAIGYQSATSCPIIPVSYSKAQILGLIQDTQYQNPTCAVDALDMYGQNVLNSYNISLNLSGLTASLSNRPSPNMSQAIAVGGGILSHVPQSIKNLEAIHSGETIPGSESNATSLTRQIKSNSASSFINGNGIATTFNNHIWSGYVVYNSTSNITYAVGTWVVQNASGPLFTHSAQWVGIGGFVDNSLVQVGTESETYSGLQFYYEWYEYDPHNTSQLSPCNTISHPFCNIVYPGNKMMGMVYLMPSTINEWNFTIFDFTTNTGYYNLTLLNSHQIPSGKTAEWIDERNPTMYSNTTLTNFNTSYYGPEYSSGVQNYTSNPGNYAGTNALYSTIIGGAAVAIILIIL